MRRRRETGDAIAMSEVDEMDGDDVIEQSNEKTGGAGRAGRVQGAGEDCGECSDGEYRLASTMLAAASGSSSGFLSGFPC